jgi:3-hydroxyisobutyrate dehydrogenase
MRVAVLGTGIMGSAMAKNIAAAGHDVVVWNRTRERAEATGLPVTATPQEAVAGSDVALTMLRDLDAVRAAVRDVDFGESVWMQSSTVGQGIEELAALGWTMVDAPVVGTRKPAEEGKLTVLLSGPAGARRAVAPVCDDVIGSKTVDLGDRIGDASKLKLVLNTWVLVLVEGTAELLALAEAAGLDPKMVLGALEGGPLDSPYLQQKGQAIIERRFDPQFKLETAHKDVGLIRELAARSGLDLAFVDAIEDRFARAIAAGHGDEDFSATWYATRPHG